MKILEVTKLIHDGLPWSLQTRRGTLLRMLARMLEPEDDKRYRKAVLRLFVDFGMFETEAAPIASDSANPRLGNASGLDRQATATDMRRNFFFEGPPRSTAGNPIAADSSKNDPTKNAAVRSILTAALSVKYMHWMVKQRNRSGMFNSAHTIDDIAGYQYGESSMFFGAGRKREQAWRKKSVSHLCAAYLQFIEDDQLNHIGPDELDRLCDKLETFLGHALFFQGFLLLPICKGGKPAVDPEKLWRLPEIDGLIAIEPLPMLPRGLALAD